MRNLNLKALVALLAAGVLLPAAHARADVASDRAAAILIFPRILASNFLNVSPGTGTTSRSTVDTLVQISNTSNDPVSLHCFYINANSHCSISGNVCGGEFNCPLPQDLCLPGWTETDFYLTATGQQPLAWSVTNGLPREEFPLDGVAFVGPRGQSNATSAVPPVTVETVFSSPPNAQFETFAGELKCIVVDASGKGIPRNVIKGEATVMSQVEQISPTVNARVPRAEKYSAIGIQAIEGDTNGDGILQLGGDANEYNGCPNVLIVDHFFDDAVTIPLGEIESELTLVPCTQDLREQVPGSTTAQFLVFNEFEQRFSTSQKVDCYFRRQLSTIDTPSRERSIFNVAVAGTLAGQTRIRGVSSGLLGILAENHQIPTTAAAEIFGSFGQNQALPIIALDNASNLHFQGDRSSPDRVVLP